MGKRVEVRTFGELAAALRERGLKMKVVAVGWGSEAWNVYVDGPCGSAIGQGSTIEKAASEAISIYADQREVIMS